VLVLALSVGLSTATVYAEADRLGVARPPEALADRRRELAAALRQGAPLPAAGALLHNDLQRAAVSLCPQIAEVIGEARDAGAQLALVSGSGPTVIGLFGPGAGLTGTGPAAAERAAAGMRGRVPAAISAGPVDAAFARAVTVEQSSRRRRASQSPAKSQ
jgi:4-diphosphocytidyl-2-C-methyl-D-erythritol kinase